MYGEEKLNAHNAMRYCLTKEFFETFKLLRYKGIEIPLTLVRPFHVYIKPYVNKNVTNRSLAAGLMKKHRCSTMKQIQTSLLRKPKIVRDLSKVRTRNTTLLPAKLINFAMDKMRSKNVILVVSDQQDRMALKGVSIPKNFRLYKYHKALKQESVSSRTDGNLRQIIRRTVRANRSHPIFGTVKFANWLYKHSVTAIKTINALEKLIRKQSIGVMIDHVEIINPGTTLSLLAAKFNLPYVNMPQLLIADRSLIPSRASYHLVWGKNYKDWLLKRGIHPSQIKMTGNLKFQYAMKKTYSSKSAFIKQFLIPSNHTVITYTSQPFHSKVNTTVMRWVSQTASQQFPVTFLIKPHPGDKFNYASYTSNPNIKLLSKNSDLYNVLKHSDMVMTISSNTAVEAAMFNKGIIVLQPPMTYDYEHHNNNFNSHLVQARAGVVAYNVRQLQGYVSRLSRSPRLRASLAARAKHFLNQTAQTSKKPSDAAYKVIRNLIGKKLKVSAVKSLKRRR